MLVGHSFKTSSKSLKVIELFDYQDLLKNKFVLIISNFEKWKQGKQGDGAFPLLLYIFLN